jgi:hypothetical protein
METWTVWTPEPASECVPQKPLVPQPAFQPAAPYVVEATGKEVVELGAVLSIRRFETAVDVPVFPATSVATARTS